MRSIIVKGAIIIGILIVLVFTFFYFANYSTGTRAGIVMKVSKKGVLFKTYEGMLDVGTINDPWNFSVDPSRGAIIDELNEVQASGERVQLHYQEKFAKFFWRGDTKYFVTKVDRIKKPNQRETVQQSIKPEADLALNDF